MSRTEIFSKLKEILVTADLRDIQSLDTCTEETKLTTELGLTSVAMLYVVIMIEETFQIHFQNVGVADFQTIGDVIDHIQKCQ